jgi:predicted ester cyclase
MLHTAFPDLRFTQEDLMGEGQLVAMRFTASGTQRGPLQGRRPTGKRVTWHGLVLSRVVDGRIASEWHALDPSDFMRWLGMPNGPPPQ